MAHLQPNNAELAKLIHYRSIMFMDIIILIRWFSFKGVILGFHGLMNPFTSSHLRFNQ